MDRPQRSFPTTVGKGGGLQISQRASVGDEVYDALLSQLISLKIPPRARISVDALVRELGVSQTPIRAALIRLESEGLVEKKHNAGYSAAPLPSGRRFEEIYELRSVLEPYAVGKATETLSQETLARLRQAHAAMGQVGAGDARLSYGKFANLDAEFHALIAEAAGNTVIMESLERLYTHMHLFRLQYHATVTEEAILEHANIIEAMGQGDARAAAEAMRCHIENSRQRMSPYFQPLDE